ncbi:MAG: UvrD-helicase domain-containing protein, partial [Acidobacteriota bacterium]
SPFLPLFPSPFASFVSCPYIGCIRLTVKQTSIAESPVESRIFLEGIAGAGKTTTGVHRLRHLLRSGVPAHSILVLVPQKRLALPYYREMRNPRRKAGAEVTVATLGSLSRHIVSLFWPLIAAPEKHPIFLSLEMVQYLMSSLIGPVIEQNDYFNSVKINRARLYSQIVDNLNKASLVGFPYIEFARRLKSASKDDPEKLHIYDDAQVCANLFRDYCVKESLIDFSLQVSLFLDRLWKLEAPRSYLTNRFTHLIADNLEEDTPATHRLLQSWLGHCRSALLIYDADAGYRRFLGADEVNALSLRSECATVVTLEDTRVMSADTQALLTEVHGAMSDEPLPAPTRRRKGDAQTAIAYTGSNESRFHTQMLDWVARSVATLIREQGVKAAEVVILAPLLSDSLRFSLVTRLEGLGVETYTLRPSRPLRAEGAARALLTLAKLAHPNWQFDQKYEVRKFDVIQTLVATVGDIDLARATLLAEVLFKTNELRPFSGINDATMRARISEVFGARYERLRNWLENYKSQPSSPIDVFFSRLFGEVLSQKGFGFHKGFDAARVTASLIDSSRNFRQTLTQMRSDADIGNEYVTMVDSGVIADQYEPQAWKRKPNAVLIAPAYTFLLSNQAVDYQFWLNIDSPAWGRRLYQPLTQPYVLSLQWHDGEVWNESHEQNTSQEMLYRVVTGLIKRCRRKVFIGYSQFNERGFEQMGELRVVFDVLLRRLSQESRAETAGTEDGDA